MPTNLSVNVDHVATLREARGTDYPDPVEASRVAERAGASGITVHLRGDRRHIQERDVDNLRKVVQGKLNLEMAATDEMVGLALRMRPDQVTLVPERPEELTTEGGLHLPAAGVRVVAVAQRLSEAGIAISVFVDPESEQIDWLAASERGLIHGFELNTDRYARARNESDRSSELEKIQKAARGGAAEGLRVYAGHALTTRNVGAIAAVPQIEELNIGHFLIGRAVIVGMATAVQEMLEAMAQGESSAATPTRDS